MLCALRVRNLLLLDQLELNLEPGFNVMTGETGGGKSVVIGALKLVLGGRALPEQVRPGCDEAEVEALFDLSDSPAARARLLEAGIAQGDELVVRRVLSTSSRSRAYLNGRLTTAGELSALAPHLADIASQHESVTLTDPSSHLGYLDAFGVLEASRRALSERVEALQQLRKQVASLEEVARDRAEREAFLRFQLAAIDEVAPHPGESEALRLERSRLRSATRLADVASRASLRLVDGEPSVCDELRGIVGDLRGAVDLDPSLADALALVDSANQSLLEAGRNLQRYAEGVQADPARLDAVEGRLFTLEKLLRLHGPTEDDALAARDRILRDLDVLEEVDGRVDAMREQFASSLREAGKMACALSEARKQVAGELASAISKELAALGMGGARVEVEIAPHDGTRAELEIDGARLTPDGLDRVEFLIAPNKGIAPRPLRKIASGGELSRSLLAIKRVLASKGPAGLYVFDEVDTGVGGAIAERLGQALADIARHRQVLCITHLAPIASLADAHFVVRKTQQGAVATTAIEPVRETDRVREVARMLSGARISRASLQTAEEMLRSRAAAVS